MSILSARVSPAAGVIHRGLGQVFLDQPTAANRLPAKQRFEQVDMLVASKDVLQARKALLACPDAAILRSVPMPRDNRVKLEIRFPAGQVATVIARIQACLPCGEIGGVVACVIPCVKPRREHAKVVHIHGF
ncbi:hypothetical protein ACHMXK_02520 [Polaromonas sp. UC242_47]